MDSKKHTNDSRKRPIHIIILLVLGLSLIAAFLGPPIIDEVFDEPAPNWFLAVSWGKNEALGYYGSALGFLGTVILGAVAVFQTDRANKQTDIANEYAKKANDQTERANQLAQEALEQAKEANKLTKRMQQLEQAARISIISIESIWGRKFSAGDNVSSIPDLLTFDMVDYEYWPFRQYYQFDIRIKNESIYPIIQLQTRAQGCSGNPSLKYGTKNAENELYISPNTYKDISCLVPTTFFDKYRETKISLELTFVNILDYSTWNLMQVHLVHLGSPIPLYIGLHLTLNYQVDCIVHTLNCPTQIGNTITTSSKQVPTTACFLCIRTKLEFHLRCPSS